MRRLLLSVRIVPVTIAPRIEHHGRDDHGADQAGDPQQALVDKDGEQDAQANQSPGDSPRTPDEKSPPVTPAVHPDRYRRAVARPRARGPPHQAPPRPS